MCFGKPHRGIERRSSWMGQRKLDCWNGQRLEVFSQGKPGRIQATPCA